MEDVVLISGPAVEPVTTQEVKNQAYIPAQLTAYDDYIANVVIPGARADIEDEIRRALVYQTWLYKLDGFPGFDTTYHTSGYAEITIPKPPLVQILSFNYIDTAGVVQTLNPTGRDGVVPLVNGQDPFYGYQVDPGSETQPGRVIPPWARPWPPARRVPMSVQIQFVAGFGTLLAIGIAQGTTTILGAKFYSSDVGLPITIAGAGSASPLTDLVTTIAAVDNNGVATTADQAGASVSGASLWWRRQIPPALKQAILLQAAHRYQYREAITDRQTVPLARGVEDITRIWKNRTA